YRDTELGRRHPLAELLADLRRQTGVERIAISGLDAAAVASFVEQVAGHVLEGEDEQFARAIYAETERNPFFIGEVLRHLAVSGAPGAAPRCAFAHARVRGTLYGELTAARRVALHRKVAEAVEQVHAGRIDDHLRALAYHYPEPAVPAAEPAKAVDYARRAGD